MKGFSHFVEITYERKGGLCSLVCTAVKQLQIDFICLQVTCMKRWSRFTPDIQFLMTVERLLFMVLISPKRWLIYSQRSACSSHLTVTVLILWQHKHGTPVCRFQQAKHIVFVSKISANVDTLKHITLKKV